MSDDRILSMSLDDIIRMRKHNQPRARNAASSSASVRSQGRWNRGQQSGRNRQHRRGGSNFQGGFRVPQGRPRINRQRGQSSNNSQGGRMKAWPSQQSLRGMRSWPSRDSLNSNRGGRAWPRRQRQAISGIRSWITQNNLASTSQSTQINRRPVRMQARGNRGARNGRKMRRASLQRGSLSSQVYSAAKAKMRVKQAAKLLMQRKRQLQMIQSTIQGPVARIQGQQQRPRNIKPLRMAGNNQRIPVIQGQRNNAVLRKMILQNLLKKKYARLQRNKIAAQNRLLEVRIDNDFVAPAEPVSNLVEERIVEVVAVNPLPAIVNRTPRSASVVRSMVPASSSRQRAASVPVDYDLKFSDCSGVPLNERFGNM